MPWWAWMLLGLALLGLEILTPGGFFVLFFGIGAVVVGVLVGLGIGGPPWAEWFVFSVVSVASLIVFRGRLVAWLKRDDGTAAIDTLAGEVAILLDDLAPGAVGKAELRGTSWTARNADDRPLAKGERCHVAHVEGLTLHVRSESASRQGGSP